MTLLPELNEKSHANTLWYQLVHVYALLCRLNDEARKLFEELGSTAVKELAFRDSWVFVGAKGIENKSPFEQVCWCDSCCWGESC